MLVSPDPTVLAWDAANTADAVAAISDMLTARAVLRELGDAASIDDLPELLRPPRVVITAPSASDLLETLRVSEAQLDALGVELTTRTSFDSGIV